MLHPLLYEINTRCWLRELSQKHGRPVTLANIGEEDLKGWRRLGFTHIWLMGVWTAGPRSREQALAKPQRQHYTEVLPDLTEADVGGSPYAVADYVVAPGLGGNAGLAQFRSRLQSEGLKLLLDFVPNHVGVDHPWLREKPHLFVQRQNAGPGTFSQATVAGSRQIAFGKDPYFPPWTDTAQLDYRRPDTRQEMLRLLTSIAGLCDGVRCDMAMLVLNEVFLKNWQSFPSSAAKPSTEFWAEAIGHIKQRYTHFLFLAEAYWGTEPRLHALGFDHTYDKELYDKLVSQDGAGAQEHLLRKSSEEISAGAHFLENHDEPRIASLLSLPEHRAAALLALSLPGMRFLHQGQLSGAQRHVPVQLLRRPIEPVQPEIENMYEQMLSTLRTTAVGPSSGELLRPRAAWPENPTSRNFIVVQWHGNSAGFHLVVVNLAPHRGQCFVPVSVPELSKHNWAMRDCLGQNNSSALGRSWNSTAFFWTCQPTEPSSSNLNPVNASSATI